MAVEARVAARMLRELKMLQTSPAPGVAAWAAVDKETGQERLDLLDAEIRGNEGTPYAGGVFRLRVEIPARYPLEPPHVKFVTPIYHPNIDSAGRICLNVLNMPPKGGWTPALNVSTILKGVQVLMNEPNPDDGLMADVTEEFKRDLTAFNSKAEALTAKYAMDINVAGRPVDGNCRLQPKERTGEVSQREEDCTSGGTTCAGNNVKTRESSDPVTREPDLTPLQVNERKRKNSLRDSSLSPKLECPAALTPRKKSTNESPQEPSQALVAATPPCSSERASRVADPSRALSSYPEKTNPSRSRRSKLSRKKK